MKEILPVIAISMGDPAGIGPEIAAKALADSKLYERCRPLVVGDASTMELAAAIAKVGAKINAIQNISEARFQPGLIDVIDLEDVDLKALVRGKVSAMAGKAAYDAVRKVIELAMAGDVDATVTGPINKEALNLAGYHYSGHTEIYADLTGTKDYTMMLAEGKLRVVHVSTHVSLREACDLVKSERVYSVIALAHEAMRAFGIEHSRIGVAGLNPHASDGGLFGWEEKNEISPAIDRARSEGMKVDGPESPDTLFSKALGGHYDIVVAMYHDQGHIPLKVVGFVWDEVGGSWKSVSGVNITLGLPIIRTSVDHGTAFEIAGKGAASEESLVSAIDYAIQFARQRMLK
jgi:4-hydroxythreonine-4-phosphate dehydrogenase